MEPQVDSGFMGCGSQLGTSKKGISLNGNRCNIFTTNQSWAFCPLCMAHGGAFCAVHVGLACDGLFHSGTSPGLGAECWFVPGTPGCRGAWALPSGVTLDSCVHCSPETWPVLGVGWLQKQVKYDLNYTELHLHPVHLLKIRFCTQNRRPRSISRASIKKEKCTLLQVSYT